MTAPSITTFPRHTMPLTQLDSRPALVVIDLQKGILGMPKAHPVDAVIDRNLRLVRAFRERGFPVALVRVTAAHPGGRSDVPANFTPKPADWMEPVAGMEPQPEDIVILKPRWDAFIGTALDHELRQRGVTQIFLTGVATSIGVESTARTAWNLGYNVVPVSDAMTDSTAEAHDNSVAKILPRIGEVTDSETVLKSLAARG